MRNHTNESALIHRFRRGDAKAFNTIYNRYYYSVRYFCLRMICQKKEAEEITVETFLKLYRLCANFENIVNVRAFLYVTGRNACYDYLAWAHRQNGHPPQEDHRPDSLLRYQADTDISEETMLKSLFEAIESLPGDCYRVFKYTWVVGLKVADIADKMNIPEHVVRGHKRRSLQLLRIALFEKQLPVAALSYLSMVKMGDQVPIKKAVAVLYEDMV